MCAQVERARGAFRRIVLVVRNGYVGHGIANVSMNPGCIRRYLGWAWREAEVSSSESRVYRAGVRQLVP